MTRELRRCTQNHGFSRRSVPRHWAQGSLGRSGGITAGQRLGSCRTAGLLPAPDPSGSAVLQLSGCLWSMRLFRAARRASVARLSSACKVSSCSSMRLSRGPMFAAISCRRYRAHTAAPTSSPMSTPRRITTSPPPVGASRDACLSCCREQTATESETNVALRTFLRKGICTMYLHEEFARSICTNFFVTPETHM